MILLILALILVSGCESSAGKAPHSISAPASPAPLQLTLAPQEDPNHYDVLISWKEESQVTEYVLERLSEPDHPGPSSLSFPEQVARIPAHPTSHVDRAVPVDRKLTYFLTTLYENGEILRSRGEIHIPYDRVHASRETLKSFSHRGRIFLDPGAVLTTDGEEVLLQMTELVARGGLLETFAENSRAPDGSHGRTSGNIALFAERASGELTVKMRGENGGNGFVGRKGFTGEGGARGRAAETELLVNPAPGVSRDLHIRHVKALEENEPRLHPSWRNIYRCKTKPEDGTEGGAGGPGERGTSGGRGGDSGRLYLEVGEAPSFRVHPEILPGKAGAGGEGGPGGDGGTAGEPGSRDPHEICPAAKKGKAGAPGKKGEKGESGTPGNALPYCLRIQRTEFGDCLSTKPSAASNTWRGDPRSDPRP